MGRSLRRIKKHKPRIVKRGGAQKKKGARNKSKLPEEITAQRPDMQRKLGTRWGACMQLQLGHWLCACLPCCLA